MTDFRSFMIVNAATNDFGMKTFEHIYKQKESENNTKFRNGFRFGSFEKKMGALDALKKAMGSIDAVFTDLIFLAEADGKVVEVWNTLYSKFQTGSLDAVGHRVWTSRFGSGFAITGRDDKEAAEAYRAARESIAKMKPEIISTVSHMEKVVEYGSRQPEEGDLSRV